MADILIRGMEIPSSCAVCGVAREANCQVDYKWIYKHPEYYDSRRDDCPLVELPEHGRLIDADKLLHPDPSTESTPFAFTACKIIEAPTVIPSNKEETK